MFFVLGAKHDYTASAQQMLAVCNKGLNEVSISLAVTFYIWP